MSDGIGWIAREEIAWAGYCITLARGLEPGELVTHLARDTAPAPLGACTGYDLNTQLVDRERALHRSDSIAVRYGAVGDLAFAVADGYWPGEMNTGPLLAGSKGGAHVFRLYHESQNPKLPPPEFTYFHDGDYMCGFDMHMHARSHEITGSRPDLVSAALQAGGVPDEDRQDVAHTKSLAVVEELFQLTLPKELVLHGKLPAALIRGQESA